LLVEEVEDQLELQVVEQEVLEKINLQLLLTQQVL
jgi:hypothetical protein